jgi:hypothetical protein
VNAFEDIRNVHYWIFPYTPVLLHPYIDDILHSIYNATNPDLLFIHIQIWPNCIIIQMLLSFILYFFPLSNIILFNWYLMRHLLFHEFDEDILHSYYIATNPDLIFYNYTNRGLKQWQYKCYVTTSHFFIKFYFVFFFPLSNIILFNWYLMRYLLFHEFDDAILHSYYIATNPDLIFYNYTNQGLKQRQYKCYVTTSHFFIKFYFVFFFPFHYYPFQLMSHTSSIVS